MDRIANNIKSFIIRKIITFFIYLLIITQIIHAQEEAEPGINLIDIEEFIIQLNMAENYVIFDVRTWMEYKKNRIPGALHAGTSEVLYAYTDTMDFDQPIFLYCSTDFRSKPAGRSLAAKGFKNVYILEPGLYGWRAAHKEIDDKRLLKTARKVKK